jgi:signal transduction histidine kinase
MKKYCLLPIFVLSFMVSMGQNSPVFDRPKSSQVDSLKEAAVSTGNDTLRMAIYRQLMLFYQDINSDSSLHYAAAQEQMAKVLRQEFWQADALDNIGLSYKNIGSHAKALKCYLDALDALRASERKGEHIASLQTFTYDNSEETAWRGLEATIYLDLGNLYRETKNLAKSIEAGKESVRIATLIHNATIMISSYQVLGESYLVDGQLDSALVFLNKSIALTAGIDYENENGQTLRDIGIVYQSMDSLERAKYYFKKGIEVSRRMENEFDEGESLISLAKLYQSMGKMDSSLMCAKKGLANFKKGNRGLGMLDAYRLITALYQQQAEPDSTLHYLQLYMTLNENLFNEEKIKQFQNIGFEEQVKVTALEKEKIQTDNRIRTYSLVFGLAVVILVAFILYRNNRQKQKANLVLAATLSSLKSTQSQLIQSEKMASLGELTAGIAHEIQNPLNFVNNFSEVSNELVDEMNAHLATGNWQPASDIASALKQNLEKINHHGKRADAIVKGMLQHSRKSTGQKELTDINALCDEYLRLAYHGLRAKDKSFNAKFETHLDPTLPKINVVPQDIGRVVLNLINNAFYAVSEKAKQGTAGYEPTVSIRTSLSPGEGRGEARIQITVSDNGPGIPDSIKDKIFQPFFTTKPTGQGTGLGLSLSYDIVTKGHGGELKVDTKEGEGSVLTIILPS